MKKILYFIPEFPKLTETFIEREVSKLVELNELDIQVLSVKKATGFLSPNLSTKVIYRDINLLDFINGLLILIKSINKFGLFFRIISSDRVLSKVIRNFVYFLKSIGYASVIAKYNPDHLHAHFLSYPSTLVMFTSILLEIPFSISGHARDVFVDGELIPMKVVHAKFISICNTYAWSKCVELSRGENSSNIHKIYHGMDLREALSTTAILKKPNRPFIFAGSRLEEKKGLRYLIEASKILRDKGIDHEIHIVGPGTLYSQLVEQVNYCGLQNNIFIPGEGKGLSNAQVMEYFKVADIFAHPSIETGTGDVDGVPTFVIEASMAKVPVVTTSAGSITDLIDEESGILVKQKDAYSLADGIEKLILNPELRVKLGARAYEKAQSMFNLTKNVSALQDLLQK